jgi:hypothetical protein
MIKTRRVRWAEHIAHMKQMEIIRMIKTRMRWAERIARMRDGNAYEILVGK